MGNEHQDKWMSILPWTLLSRRAAFHTELQCSPAEAMFGQEPLLPGDMAAQADLEPKSSLHDVVNKVRRATNKPPAQNSI